VSGARIALVGARRVRQGLGPFVARWLKLEGAELPALLATSEGSARAAEAELAEHAGVAARGYTDLDALLDETPVDALAILSPAQTHATYLEAALARGLHVLCEKPLVWPGGDARALAEGFAARGLLLAENCQWPFVRGAFEALHGPVGTLASFGMRLTPASRGVQMLADALPHPLSVLQALAPDGEARLEDLTFSTHAPEAEELVLEAEYVTSAARIPVRVELIRGETLPREACLTINGRAARRRVRMEDYSLFLADEAREVPLPDPLRSLLARFLSDLDRTLGGAPPPPIDPIVQRADLLEQAARAFREGHST